MTRGIPVALLQLLEAYWIVAEAWSGRQFMPAIIEAIPIENEVGSASTLGVTRQHRWMSMSTARSGQWIGTARRMSVPATGNARPWPARRRQSKPTSVE